MTLSSRIWASSFLGLVALASGCAAPEEEAQADSNTALNLASGRDMVAETDSWANNEGFRVSLNNIAWAMGYGWSYGCPHDGSSGDGWDRSAVQSADGWSFIDYWPRNKERCPGDQPGMTARLSFRGAGDGEMRIGTPRAIPIGNVENSEKTGVWPYVCDNTNGLTGACKFGVDIQLGKRASTTKMKEFSFNQEITTGFSYKAKAAPFGLGGEFSWKFDLKVGFGQKFGETHVEETSQTTTAKYECPLNDSAKQKGHIYRGFLVKYPIKWTAPYEFPAKTVMRIDYQGFARKQDGGGNHFQGHPTDRPQKHQTYGSDSVSFWEDMRTQLTNGYVRDDLNWSDLKGNGEHSRTVDDSLRWFENYVAPATHVVASGEFNLEADEVYCAWYDSTTSSPKRVALTRPHQASGGTQPQNVNGGSDLFAQGTRAILGAVDANDPQLAAEGANADLTGEPQLIELPEDASRRFDEFLFKVVEKSQH